MYRLAFALVVVLLLWVQSLFDTTTHTVSGSHHVFAYGWLAWFFQGLFIVALLGFAWLAWRWMQDRVVAGIMLAGVPLFCLVVMPQTACERVELTDELLIHRREPPHTKYNFDIALSEIASATAVSQETGSFGTEHMFGYRFVTKDGRQYDLPLSTTLTAAHEAIGQELSARKIPLNIELRERPPAR